MTDAELIDLVQRRSPEQLSLLELERLREGLASSPALREELLGRRQMRDYLAAALERIDVPLEALLAETASHRGKRRALRRATIVVCLLLVAAGAIAVTSPQWLNRESKDVAPSPGSGSNLPAATRNSKPTENDSAARAVAAAKEQDAGSADDGAANPESPLASASGSDEAHPQKPQPPAAPVAQGPWDDALRDDAPPAPFAAAAFRPFLTSKATPSKDDLGRWFTPMNAHAQIGERRASVGVCGSLSGLFRLKAPLREGVVLRLAMEEYDRLKIHCFREEEGVTLAFYQSMNFAWAAYHTHRQAGSPQPDRYALAATDGGRGMRTESRHGGPFELRWQEGELLLSRGDVLLVRAPRAEPPSEIYFDGQATLSGLAMVKMQRFPLDPLPPLDEQPALRPAKFEWKEQLAEGAEFKLHADGGVELLANPAKRRSFVVAPLPRSGLSEVVLKIEAATPGAGVFLGRGEEGIPYEVVKFLRDQRTGRTGLSLQGDDDGHERHFESVDERMTPLVPESAWLRLLFGCGTLRVWLSADGLHWSEPFFDPRGGLPGEVTHLGLHVSANRPECRLRIGEIRLRRLPAFNALVEDNLRGQAIALPQAADYGDWLARISAAQPPEVESISWRRACAVQTLAAGCPGALGDALVNAVLDDVQAVMPAEQQFALLHEAALLLDMRSDANRWTHYAARFQRLAETAHGEGESRPFSFIRWAVMTAPVASPHQQRIGSESLIRTELIELLDQARWRDALAFCETLRFYRLDENLPLAAWARATAQRQLQDSVSETLAEQRDVWRHPLIEELSKEAYNFLAEFQALLDSEAFDEAARMIAATEPHATAGVASDRRDGRLLISLPAAIRLALRDWPELRRVMEERYADLAQLRVRRAMSEGDEAGVRSTALQFDATPAAALGARWLGDRALSRGHFEQALALYERAERTSEPALLTELAPRMRLAGAMLGREVGSAVSSDVELGDVRIAAAEFESIVQQMRERSAGSPQTAVHGAVSAPRIQDAPPPRGYTVQSPARLDGPAGGSPNELPRAVREMNIDWVARQLACVVEGDSLYVGNRFHVAAYDLNSGQRQWQSPAPPGKAARTHDWPLTPMRPLVTEKHVLCRQLTGDGPVLICFDKTNGEVAWSSQPPPGEWLASDPLVVQGRLLLLRTRPAGAREISLVLCDYDPATGEPRDQQELLRLREAPWAARRVCEVAVADDALVAALGGCVVCADLAGGVRWVRKQLSVPPDEDLSWSAQHFESPLVDSGRLYLAQPGVRSIECVDADTGRSRWTRTLPDVHRLLGLVEGRLIVETGAGFQAFDPESGESIWRIEVSLPRLEGRFLGEAGLCYVRQTRGERDDQDPRPELAWLELQTGRELSSFVLNDLKRPDLRFGPMLSHKDRLWAFAGAGPNEPNRDLLSLVPQGEADRSSVTNQRALADDAWLRHVPAPLRKLAERVLPDWRLFRGIVERQAGYYAQMHGEQDVLSIDGSRNQPVIFARRIVIPAGGRAKLRIRMAMEQIRESQLQVEFNGEAVWEEKLDEQSLGSQKWRDWEADLASRTGQTGWLTVRLIPDRDERFTSYWKRLEVAF
jgi:outer membrane protein assembly factor BamB